MYKGLKVTDVTMHLKCHLQSSFNLYYCGDRKRLDRPTSSTLDFGDGYHFKSMNSSEAVHCYYSIPLN